MQVTGTGQNGLSNLDQDLFAKIASNCSLRSVVALKCTSKENNEAINDRILREVLKNHLNIKTNSKIPVSIQDNPSSVANSLMLQMAKNPNCIEF